MIAIGLIDFPTKFTLGFGAVVFGDHVPQFGFSEHFQSVQDSFKGTTTIKADKLRCR
jgi:hypothetical protein